VVEIINYPLYPKSNEQILSTATELGHQLLDEMHQGSFTIQTPGDTFFYSRRETDKQIVDNTK